MQYARLGNTGLIVSRLCLGTMTFGLDAGIPALNKVDIESAGIMIRDSMETGVNFFDTADGYANGQSETMLGKLLSSVRHDVVIATKVGFRTGSPVTQAGLSRRHILSACDASLRRLNTDYIDLYYIHRWDPETPIDETLGALDDLCRAGKIRYAGCSNIAAHQMMASLWTADRERTIRF